jgi:hypothetical protein
MNMPRSAWFFAIFSGLFLAIITHNYAPTIGVHDFIRYWSASRLLITGGNPYDANSLLNLQKASCPKLRFDDKDVVEAWNPPWLLLTMAPLGILPFELSVRLWLFLNIFLLVMALFLTWRMAVGSNYKHFFPLILYAGFLFATTLEMIVMGQISSFVLISLILGVLLIQKEKDWISGAVLFLTTIKPHLVYLVLLVILIWAIRKRRWKIWGGMALTGLSSSFIVWLIFPDWAEVYMKKLFQMPYFKIYCSTLGAFVASVAGINHFRYIGILLLPLAIPLSKLILKDGWLTAINLSLTLSIPLSPYGFSFDHVLLLPAVTEMIAWIIKKKLPIPIAWVITVGLIITYGVLFWMQSTPGLPYTRFFLIGFALFILYFVAWRYRREGNRKT